MKPRIFHDIIFAATDEGDDAATISDAFGTGKSFDLENEEGDDEFCLMYQIKGKKVCAGPTRGFRGRRAYAQQCV